ncbi:VWA domain-containing protein [Nitratiruptor sp. SB155-2]|uniref:VWA domain-containing protein n=1 Tax=Nitratiruptor sp. (strain SB155-2) TaxID=387092 RepID=UPI0001586EC2|nr:VWA domain-containing protein [Nitratiruptor sp. SB155-2]BAF69518.1 von Willebrand factor type A domain protein [Nitratiruptor sp. SB155-2]
MKFLSFEFIPLMLLPSIVLLYLVLTNKSMVERIFEESVLSKLRIDQGLSKKMRLTLLFMALFAMILAMARPVYQKGVVQVESLSANVGIALDISNSMKATDYYPDRLQFAKKKIEEFIKASKNLNIALLAFADEAYIVSPPSSDKEALLYMLKHLDTESLALQGTNFLAALMSADMLLGKEGQKSVVLFTDGGNKEDFSKEIAFAKKRGIQVHIIGIGTQKGAPIPTKNGYMQDAKGNIVITKLNVHIAELATKTGGIFIQASYGNQDIQKILAHLESLAKTHHIEKIVDQVEFYPYLLALAFLFLFMAFFTIPSKQMTLLAVLMIGLKLHAGLTDFKLIKQAKEAYDRGAYEVAAQKFKEIAEVKGSAQSYFDAGNALYKAKKYKEAFQYYAKVQTEDKELEFRKLHNMGNCYFQLQNYQKAIEMYEKALKLKNDPDTKYNLELAKKMLQKKRKQQNKKNDQKQQNQKKSPQQKKSKNKQNSKQEKNQKNQKSQNKQKQKSKQMRKNVPISDREEKKWIKQIEKNPLKTFLYKAPLKIKKEGTDENPW